MKNEGGAAGSGIQPGRLGWIAQRRMRRRSEEATLDMAQGLEAAAALGVSQAVVASIASLLGDLAKAIADAPSAQERKVLVDEAAHARRMLLQTLDRMAHRVQAGGCGTCGSTQILARPMPSLGNAWALTCSNDHPWNAVPGEEYVIEVGE